MLHAVKAQLALGCIGCSGRGFECHQDKFDLWKLSRALPEIHLLISAKLVRKWSDFIFPPPWVTVMASSRPWSRAANEPVVTLTRIWVGDWDLQISRDEPAARASTAHRSAAIMAMQRA